MVKEDFTLDISIDNGDDKQEVISNLTVLNYPSIITATPQKNTLKLPEVGDDKIIPISLEDYFSGSVSGFTIDCPYVLDKTLTLVPPFQLVSDSSMVKEIDDMVESPDRSAVLTLYNNAITISNLQNKVVNSVGIDSQLSCKWMDANAKDIVVLCKGDSSQ